MKLEFHAESDVGRRRKHNEDSWLADRKLGLFVVCDGMGGHAAGEVASAMAVRIVHEAVSAQIAEIRTLAHGSLKQRRRLYSILKGAVRRANLTIYKSGQEDHERRGMGTTLTALLVEGPRAFIAHVGDCRLYLRRSGSVHQITDDHNLINELARAGSLGEERAFSETFTNALTRAVGVYPNVDVDTLEVDLLPGDRFLLCSDGLHGYLGDEDLQKGMDLPLQEGTRFFVEHANRSGGKDNITAVLVEVADDGDAIDTARLKLTIETLRQIPLFRHLTYAELVKVINVARAREFEAGSVIIRQGEEGEAFYIILGGRVTVEAAGVVVANLGPRRHFGEMSLVDAQPRSATVRAIEPTTLIRIVRDDFYRIVRQDTVMGVKLLWNFIQTLSARLRAADSALSAEDPDALASATTDPHIAERVSRAWAAHTAPFAPIADGDLPPLPTPPEGVSREELARMTAATSDYPEIDEDESARPPRERLVALEPERMGSNAAVVALAFADLGQHDREGALSPTEDLVAVPEEAVDIPEDEDDGEDER